MEAVLLVDMLEESGIAAFVFNENAIGAVGELPVSYPEVWIERSLDFERANIAVKRFEQPVSSGIDVVCEQCRETNPSGFEICWQCQSVLPLSVP